TVKPEAVDHFELGLKSSFTKAQFNLTLFNTGIKDYQTLVQSPELGVNRGYLANAEKVQVQGLEIETNVKATEYLNIVSSISYTDGKYLKFTNAPLPLEETGASVSFKDISGGRLPGISKWSGSIGADINKKSRLFGFEGAIIAGVNTYFRSNFSSSPSPSQYLNIDGYALFNGRLGFKTSNGTIISLWGKNIFNKNYFEQLLPAAGNAGHYAGVLGDPITFGLTVKFTIK
ncbi:MAG: Pesticin receptor, partial [Bacteroidota bacterium]